MSGMVFGSAVASRRHPNVTVGIPINVIKGRPKRSVGHIINEAWLHAPEIFHSAGFRKSVKSINGRHPPLTGWILKAAGAQPHGRGPLANRHADLSGNKPVAIKLLHECATADSRDHTYLTIQTLEDAGVGISGIEPILCPVGDKSVLEHFHDTSVSSPNPEIAIPVFTDLVNHCRDQAICSGVVTKFWAVGIKFAQPASGTNPQCARRGLKNRSHIVPRKTIGSRVATRYHLSAWHGVGDNRAESVPPCAEPPASTLILEQRLYEVIGQAIRSRVAFRSTVGKAPEQAV